MRLPNHGETTRLGRLWPALTTVRINGGLIGTQAAGFLIDRAEGRPVAQRIVDVGFSIVERESTGLVKTLG